MVFICYHASTNLIEHPLGRCHGGVLEVIEILHVDDSCEFQGEKECLVAGWKRPMGEENGFLGGRGEVHVGERGMLGGGVQEVHIRK